MGKRMGDPASIGKSPPVPKRPGVRRVFQTSKTPSKQLSMQIYMPNWHLAGVFIALSAIKCIAF
jgi:hypothetical protein